MAFKYFKMAADKNHMEAIYNIGLMLEQGTNRSGGTFAKQLIWIWISLRCFDGLGHGMKPNKKEAKKYFKIVAATGHQLAISKLQEMENSK